MERNNSTPSTYSAGERMRADGSGVDPAAARSAVKDAVARATRLIQTVQHPHAPSVGVWDTMRVAIHLDQVWEILPALARQERPSPVKQVADLDGVMQALVSAATPVEMSRIAQRIEASAASFLAYLDGRSPWETVPWLIEGTDASLKTICCNLLNRRWDWIFAYRDVRAAAGTQTEDAVVPR